MKNIKLNNKDLFDYSKNAGNWGEDEKENGERGAGC